MNTKDNNEVEKERKVEKLILFLTNLDSYID